MGKRFNLFPTLDINDAYFRDGICRHRQVNFKMPAHIPLIDHASLSIEASTTKIVKTEDRLKVLNFLLDLDNNAGIDIQASNGKTALHFACFNGYLEIIDRLLERGADTTITCREEFDFDISCVVFNLPAQGLGVAYGRHNILPIFEKYGKLTTGAVTGQYT